MATLIATNQITLIVGLGITGQSVARYLASRNQHFCFADETSNKALIEQIRSLFPNVDMANGPLEFNQWSHVTRIILSPGVPRKHPAIQQAINAGIEVIGDIELFAREAKAPIVAITGSNGKTTATSLLGEMAKGAGVNVAVGGNLGTPALDLLGDNVELYVLELSSFQLESTKSLKAAAATVLNISQDHMDRYENLHEYFLCKQTIYHGAKHVVMNKDDVFTQPPIAGTTKGTYFGQSAPDLKDFGLLRDENGTWLARGLTPLVREDAILLRGKHNLMNALAALALGSAVMLPMESMIAVLKQFRGLPHRCQFVAKIKNVEFVNDSKATNIGATIAALNGLANVKNIVLLAGGDGKGADFNELKDSVAKHVKNLVLFGKDADQIQLACQGLTQISRVTSLQEAVAEAVSAAQPGDMVLLSPACASLDMFKNYQDRGNQFMALVEGMCP